MNSRALWLAALAVFCVCSWGLPLLVEPWRDVAVDDDLLSAPYLWEYAPAPGAAASEGDGPRWLLARSVEVAAETGHLSIELCPGMSVERWALSVVLLSANSGYLDFNRHHQFRALPSSSARGCVADGFTRLDGDDEAFVLVASNRRLPAEDPLSLALRQKVETPTWAWLRVVMLITGLLFLAGLFSTYRFCRPHWLVLAGLAGVGAIVFGCCVSVALKADIYALIDGGGRRVAATLQELLSEPLPQASFGIFTELHAILFCATTLTLALLRRSAGLDLFVLAVTTETLQMFVPGRGPGIGDVAVDLSGVAAAYLLLFALWRSKRVRLFLKYQAIDEDAARF